MKARYVLPCLCAGLLAACSPPNEQDSTQQLSPAAVAAEESATNEPNAASDNEQVGFINCAGAEPVVEPEEIFTDCINADKPVKWIAWRTWNEDEAMGWGRLDGKAVKIELGQPIVTSSGKEVFSSVSLNGAQITL